MGGEVIISPFAHDGINITDMIKTQMFVVIHDKAMLIKESVLRPEIFQILSARQKTTHRKKNRTT